MEIIIIIGQLSALLWLWPIQIKPWHVIWTQNTNKWIDNRVRIASGKHERIKIADVREKKMKKENYELRNGKWRHFIFRDINGYAFVQNMRMHFHFHLNEMNKHQINVYACSSNLHRYKLPLHSLHSWLLHKFWYVTNCVIQPMLSSVFRSRSRFFKATIKWMCCANQPIPWNNFRCRCRPT